MNKKEKKTQKKIDIGVVTFFASNNFGAVLQAYALQKKIMGLGYSTEVLNYQEEEVPTKQTEKSKTLSAYKAYFRMLKSARFNIKTLMKARKQAMLSAQKFDVFRNDFMKITIK